MSPRAATWVLTLPLLYLLLDRLYTPSRIKKVRKHDERVLVLGATSGVGRNIAVQYAKRGAKVCVVGRRKHLVDEVVAECRAITLASEDTWERVMGMAVDFSNVEDMVRLRGVIEHEWKGLDTLHVSAGVSALRPLLDVAGSSRDEQGKLSQSTSAGIKHTVDVASKALVGNFYGPLVGAITFIPLLSTTSTSPSIVLLNSLASVIPAPTRTLYAATKSSSLLLYSALRIEHPEISFSLILPATITGDFRAGAVDSSPSGVIIREKVDGGNLWERTSFKGGGALKTDYVAGKCIEAVDEGKRVMFLPRTMYWAHLLYWIMPGAVEWGARRKYNFETQ